MNGTNDMNIARENDEWKALGKCLDVIFEAVDEGVNPGFVRGKWGLLDKKLAIIEASARKARRILRPNAKVDFSEGSEAE